MDRPPVKHQRDTTPLPALSVTERLGDALFFVRRPTPYALLHPWSGTLAIALLCVFTLDFAIDTTLYLVLEKLDEASGFLPALIDYEVPLGQELLSAIILAPILEEALFRGWLSGKVASLRFGAIGFVALGILLASEFMAPNFAALALLASFGLCIVGLVQWSARRDHETEVPAWFTTNFHWFVWGSSVLFGLYHLGNFEPLTSPLGLLVIVPYTLGGVFLAYTRTRLGLVAAMLHHALYNAVAMAMYYEVIPSF